MCMCPANYVGSNRSALPNQYISSAALRADSPDDVNRIVASVLSSQSLSKYHPQWDIPSELLSIQGRLCSANSSSQTGGGNDRGKRENGSGSGHESEIELIDPPHLPERLAGLLIST